MKKVWNLIVKYRIYIVIFIVVVFTIFVGVTLKAYIDPVDETVVWGNRLNGRDEVPITNEKIKEIEDFIKKDEKVTNTSVRVVGNIIKVIINTSDKDTIDKMKEMGNNIVKEFSDKEVAYYEFGFFIQNKDENYVLLGEKKNSNQNISWVSDKLVKEEVEVDEKEQ